MRPRTREAAALLAQGLLRELVVLRNPLQSDLEVISLAIGQARSIVQGPPGEQGRHLHALRRHEPRHDGAFRGRGFRVRGRLRCHLVSCYAAPCSHVPAPLVPRMRSGAAGLCRFHLVEHAQNPIGQLVALLPLLWFFTAMGRIVLRRWRLRGGLAPVTALHVHREGVDRTGRQRARGPLLLHIQRPARPGGEQRVAQAARAQVHERHRPAGPGLGQRSVAGRVDRALPIFANW
mmetsp:Transcript_18251/g.48609  ORF Transcript_18251/g.48609 Transcript_18251/m.48609 type:complete len:234 (-) Transcript_18251:1741-2442(-)